MEDASKLVFRSVYCSSEDPRHPVSNLERPIKSTNGWQSEHFCDFPQQIVLSFKDVVEVRVFQFLSHEYMIASKVVFYIGCVGPEDKEPPSFHGVEWKRLGYVSLDKNDKTEYRARELKTIQFSAHHVAYLKIVLQRNHVNVKNLYNQVGIVGFRCFGSTERSFENNPHFSMARKELLGPTKSHSVVDQSVELSQLRPPARSTIPVREDLEFEKEFDPKTIERIHELTVLKEKAAQDEDYIAAASIKGKIEKLKKYGRKIAKLEDEKRVAVQDERYEDAQRLKHEIEQVREESEKSPRGKESSHLYWEAKRKKQGMPLDDEDKGEDSRRHARGMEDPHSPAGSLMPPEKDSEQLSPGTSQQHEQGSPRSTSASPEPQASKELKDDLFGPTEPDASSTQSLQPAQPPPGFGGGDTQGISNDEIPVSGMKSIPPEWEGGESESSVAPRTPKRPPPAQISISPPSGRATKRTESHAVVSGMGGGGGGASASGGSRSSTELTTIPYEDMTEFQKEIVRGMMNSMKQDPGLPEEVSAKDRKLDSFSPIKSAFGDFISRCVFSKAWALREGIATSIGECMDSGRVALEAPLEVSLVSVTHRLMQVVIAGIQLFGMVFKKFKVPPHHDLVTAISQALIQERVIDSNQRIRETASSLLISLAQKNSLQGKTLASMTLAGPSKKGKAATWKAHLYRYEFLHGLLEATGSSMDDPTMQRIAASAFKEGLQHANDQVRKMAISVIADLCRLKGRTWLNQYMSHVKPLQAPIIEEALAGIADPDGADSGGGAGGGDGDGDGDASVLLSPQTSIPAESSGGTSTPRRKKSQPRRPGKSHRDGEDSLAAISTQEEVPEEATASPKKPPRAKPVKKSLRVDQSSEVSDDHEEKAASKESGGSSSALAASTGGVPIHININVNAGPGATVDAGDQQDQQQRRGGGGGAREPRRRPQKVTTKPKRQDPYAPVAGDDISGDEMMVGDSLQEHEFARPDDEDDEMYDGEMLDDEEDLEPFTCPFCEVRDDSLSEGELDLHYWQECPMLVMCNECGQVIEVANYTDHLLEECDFQHRFGMCQRCREAIPKAQLEEHESKGTCRMHSDREDVQRCPLCHKDIPNGIIGWKNHFLGRSVCVKNTRARKKSHLVLKARQAHREMYEALGAEKRPKGAGGARTDGRKEGDVPRKAADDGPPPFPMYEAKGKKQQQHGEASSKASRSPRKGPRAFDSDGLKQRMEMRAKKP